MAEDRALTVQAKAQTIRALFNDGRVKTEIQKALPRHLTADKLIRVAMTSIQRNPKLMDCTQQSLLGAIMTCAALGLEPDQFLGQAYLVPYWNSKKKCYEAQLIPGYRGYISLARRTGEVQSVSSQVVYQNDHFDLQYGLNERLDHSPCEGDRGDVKGAYVIFRYKDGSYSFDYMPIHDILEIAKRSQTYDKERNVWTGPWDTDMGEMAKKTVIKRHSKLAPMSVEFQKAVALEERANLGETQIDLMADDAPGALIEADTTTADNATIAAEFDKATADRKNMAVYISAAVKHFGKQAEEVKAEAMKNLPAFLEAFEKWEKGLEQKKAKATGEKKEAPMTEGEAPERFECPDGGFVTTDVCGKCAKREIEGVKCPAIK